MAHESSYVPGNVVEKWIDDRLPIIRWSKEHLMDYPTPKNLNYWWTLGAIPACFMTLMFAEAIMVTRERRPDPWRQHRRIGVELVDQRPGHPGNAHRAYGASRDIEEIAPTRFGVVLMCQIGLRRQGKLPSVVS